MAALQWGSPVVFREGDREGAGQGGRKGEQGRWKEGGSAGFFGRGRVREIRDFGINQEVALWLDTYIYNYESRLIHLIWLKIFWASV